MQVTRRMLSTALADADNQRFILLSDSCIPLYSPVVVYQQLMHEWRSRISACALPSWDRSIERCEPLPPPLRESAPPPICKPAEVDGSSTGAIKLCMDCAEKNVACLYGKSTQG